ncbi:SH3 domain-containing protein [Tieghemostelium lacteum]|uniref:SH3 domain-containing protein n=1 Tax=Tieghemostelium lacteum TaxID=361077 RepID=A0A151ZG41_TIELA|nr:SH3 domain-containing protein [Tieghemostelium lacteum]|eukprot:KYQ92834.1 SH3 domain-containing protein [Tieghemostelium lacteum]
MSDRFKDNFWGPNGFEVIEKRMNEGSESTKLFNYFMKERAAIEESYSKSLSKLLKNTQALNEFGTLRDAWFAVRGECESLVRVHHELSVKLDKDIAGPFSKFKTEQKKIKKQYMNDATKLNREKKDLENNINRAKAKFDDYSKQAETTAASMESAKNSGKNASEIGKISQKLQKINSSQSIAEQEYKDHVNKLTAYQPQWEEKLSVTYNTLQSCEEERIDYIKVQLEKYVGALTSTVPDKTTTNNNLVAVVSKIDKHEDIACFVRENKTGSERPDPPKFIPFGGKASSEYVQSKASYQPPVQTSSLTSSYASSSSVSSISKPPPSKPSAQKQCRALYDYVGSDASELDFFAGDIINIIEEDDSGWWKGEMDSRVGIFPSNYTESI